MVVEQLGRRGSGERRARARLARVRWQGGILLEIPGFEVAGLFLFVALFLEFQEAELGGTKAELAEFRGLLGGAGYSTVVVQLEGIHAPLAEAERTLCRRVYLRGR